MSETTERTKRFYVRGDNGKEAFIGDRTEGVDGMRLSVDIDDVDRLQTAYALQKALAILNYYWDSPMWEHAGAIPQELEWQVENGDVVNESETWNRRDAAYRELMKRLRFETEATP